MSSGFMLGLSCGALLGMLVSAALDLLVARRRARLDAAIEANQRHVLATVAVLRRITEARDVTEEDAREIAQLEEQQRRLFKGVL